MVYDLINEKCQKCDNNSAYVRRYSGERLCSECFSHSILRKTAKTISKYKMIKHDDLVAVAVSGGKDSLSLLHILEKMSRAHNFRIEAFTIDEGIPIYRQEALKIVDNFCRSINVKHSTYSYKDMFDLTLDEALEKREEKISSCSICGVLRRRVMDQAAAEINADVIATGHNLDDSLQTFLINMLAGDTGRIGFTNSTRKPIKIKPFCEIYESEIVFYAFTNNIPFQTESCPHMNEGIRTEIREMLNKLEENHFGIKNNLYRSIGKLSSPITKKSVRCSICNAECTGQVCSVCKTLRNLRS